MSDDDDKIIEFRKKDGKDTDDIDEILGRLDEFEEDEGDAQDLDDRISEQVNEILRTGIENNASRIHLEAFKDEYIYRFDIDGKLSKGHQIDPAFYRPMLTRLKLMAGVDITERRLPQDGKIKVKLKGDDAVHLFFTYFLPTIYDENATLRLFSDPSNVIVNLSDQVKEILAKAVDRNRGLIVLMSDDAKLRSPCYYTVMNLISSPDRRVVNIHEEILQVKLENIANVAHVRVNPSIGYDPGRAFRAAVAVSPSVIMMDRVNTKEFMDFFHTLLKSDFVYIISTTAAGILEFMRQVLDQGVDLKDFFLIKPLFIRVNHYDQICPQCSEEVSCSDEDKTWLEGMGFDISKGTFRKGQGCKACLGTGFSGQEIQEEVLSIGDDCIGTCLQGFNADTISLMADRLIRIPDTHDIIDRIVKGDLSYQGLAKVREDIVEWNQS